MIQDIVNHTIFAINILTLLFLLAGASYFYKQKRFENNCLFKVTNLLTMGIILVSVSVMIDIVRGFQNYFDINYFFENVGMKLVDLFYVSEFAILPLAGISLLIAMVILKRYK